MVNKNMKEIRYKGKTYRINHLPFVIREEEHQSPSKRTKWSKIRSVERDNTRRSLAPGLRISASGRLYREYRDNRSDKRGRRI
jgi:hypothetical protein